MRLLNSYSSNEQTNDTQLSSTANGDIQAVQLDTNKIFIAYDDNQAGRTQLYGIVCVIVGTEITIGNAKLIKNTYGGSFTIAKLSSSKVFLIYNYINPSNYLSHESVLICGVGETSISVGSSTELNSTSGDVYSYIQAVALSDSKVVLFSRGNNSNYKNLYATVFSISSSGSITKGTMKAVVSEQYLLFSVAMLNEGKIFITYYTTSNNYNNLRAKICTIDGNSVSVGNEISLSTVEYSGYKILAIALSESKVIVFHSSTNYKLLYAIVCEVNGSNISKGIDTQLSNLAESGMVLSGIALNESQALIAHNYDDNYYLDLITCIIIGTTITKQSNCRPVEQSNVAREISMLLNNKNIFIAHRNNETIMYGSVIDSFEVLVKSITSSTEQIGGVAITSGQAGEMVSVKKPDEMLEITLNATITAGGNSISWNNVKLSHRRHLDGDNRVYTASKTISINNVTYTIKFYITYVENSGWRIGFECPPGMYLKESTDKYTNIYWLSSITKPVARSETYYTGANNTGTQISVTANITDVTI